MILNWRWIFLYGTFIIIRTLTSFYFNKVFIFLKNWVKFILFLSVSLIENLWFVNFNFIKVIFMGMAVYFMVILSEIICILNKDFISLLNLCCWTLVLILRISFYFSTHQIIMTFGWVDQKVWFRWFWLITCFYRIWWLFFRIGLSGLLLKNNITETVFINNRIGLECSSTLNNKPDNNQNDKNNRWNDNCQYNCKDFIATLWRNILWCIAILICCIGVINYDFVNRDNAHSSKRIWCWYRSFYKS